MKNLVENFKHFLTEEKSVYTAEFLVVAEPGTRLYGKVFEAIRGVEGVTVIRSTEALERDDKNNKLRPKPHPTSKAVSSLLIFNRLTICKYNSSVVVGSETKEFSISEDSFVLFTLRFQ